MVLKKSNSFTIIDRHNNTNKILLENIPYVIEIDTKTKNFFLVNYYGKYLYNSCSRANVIDNNFGDDFETNQLRLFDDTCIPWKSTDNFIKYIKHFHNIISYNNLNYTSCDTSIFFFKFFNKMYSLNEINNIKLKYCEYEKSCVLL